MTKLCKDFGFGELKGSNTLNFEIFDDNDTILDESGQRRHRQLRHSARFGRGDDRR